MQTLQDMHAGHVDAFSSAPEDTPHLLQRHIPAVGLDPVLGLLDAVIDGHRRDIEVSR